MSILEELQNHVSTGRLSFVRPMLPGRGVERNIFVSTEVGEFLNGGASVHARFDRVAGEARAQIDAFTTGRAIRFAMDPMRKDPATLVARNAPTSKGIVDMRIRQPRPQIRIFGAFAQVDSLILLTWEARDNLRFGAAVKRCRAQWDLLFPQNSPLIGATHAEYISRNIIIG
ncbi:hypothetical protein GGD46_006512 [Rhizobium lusitanum]|nr:hypothetical protein [Rhizobium lusitanum]